MNTIFSINANFDGFLSGVDWRILKEAEGTKKFNRLGLEKTARGNYKHPLAHKAFILPVPVASALDFEEHKNGWFSFGSNQEICIDKYKNFTVRIQGKNEIHSLVFRLNDDGLYEWDSKTLSEWNGKNFKPLTDSQIAKTVYRAMIVIRTFASKYNLDEQVHKEKIEGLYIKVSSLQSDIEKLQDTLAIRLNQLEDAKKQIADLEAS